MENRKRFGLDSITVEDVNELFEDNNVRAHFTFKRAKIMAALIYIDGINKKDDQGRFFVENTYLCSLADIAEKNLINALRAFEKNGYITREVGTIERKASKYFINYPKLEEGDEITTYDFEKVSSESKKVSSNFDKKVSSEMKNVSIDTDIDKELELDIELDLEKDINIIQNILNNIDIKKYNKIKLIIRKKENITYSNTKEKESYSSINEKQSSINENKETKEIETMKDLINKINALQDENSKLKERLNNCARQFKQMMQENNEMKRTMKELQLKVTELEAKQKNTSTNETSTNQEKSDSKPSIAVDCILPHTKEEKPTVAQQMPSTAIVDSNATPKEEEKQREVQKNVDVNEVMKVFADVVKQYEEQYKERCNEGVLNTFKTYIFQDLDDKKVDNSKRKKVEERINNYINYYKGKSNSKPSNDSTLTTTHQEEEKTVDCSETASNQIVEEDTTEAISSPTASDNDSTLTTTHQKEEKSVDCSEMPLNEKKLRYLDTKTDKQYQTEAEAQMDGVNPWFLYDFKVGRCITEYTSPSIPSNVDDGIVAHANEEKPTVLQQKPSTAIVEDDANQEKVEKAVEKKHMYFFEVTTLTDEILNDLKKNYPINEWAKLFKIDWVNKTIQSKTSRDILGYGEESKELRDMIAMDSKESKRLMKMVGVGV